MVAAVDETGRRTGVSRMGTCGGSGPTGHLEIVVMVGCCIRMDIETS